MMKPFIKAALAGENLDRDNAQAAMTTVMRGDATPAQIAAWLVALRVKGETVDEVAGFAHAMRAAMVPLGPVPAGCIDTCGTGGDGLDTFNISTTAGLIAASCGVPVAKHGNRAVSSQSGSADVLSALGFAIDREPQIVAAALRKTNFAFMFAPRFHPAMKHATPPRREIGIRTVFNILGPLCNPAQVKRQIIGVYDPNWMVPLAKALGALGAERALIVCGADDADELLPTGESRIAEWDGGRVREYTISPAEAGLPPCAIADLGGGDAEANAAIIRRIAAGDHGPKTDAAVFNAAAALMVAGRVGTIAAGVVRAREAVSAGRFAETLKAAAAASRSGA